MFCFCFQLHTKVLYIYLSLKQSIYVDLGHKIIIAILIVISDADG